MAQSQLFGDNKSLTEKVEDSEATEPPTLLLKTWDSTCADGRYQCRAYPSARGPASGVSSSDALRQNSTRLRKLLRRSRIEENGIRPLPVEERKERRFFNVFTIWFSINSNILAYVWKNLNQTSH